MAVTQEYLDRTWSDFTKRMKGSQVTQEDWTAFYKKYHGFIVCYIRKHSNMRELQIQAVVDKVVNAIFIDHALDKYNKEKGKRFRYWFAALIHHKMIDYYRSLKDNNTVYLDEEGLEDVSDPNTESNTDEEDEMWRSYIAYLALDEVSQKSPPAQVQCFLWRVCHNKKPAEIAPVLNMEPEQVSEAVRSFKDKVTHAFKQMGETLDMETTDWKELKLSADAARDIYLHEADAFTERMMQK